MKYQTEAVRRWVAVREVEGCPVSTDPEAFGCEADHSARGGLLARLLCGGEPLPEAPPKAFSRPWYGLIDAGAQGLTEEMEVWEWPVFEGHAPEVVINQHGWLLVAKHSAQDYSVAVKRKDGTAGARFRVTATGPGRFFKHVWHLRPEVVG